MTVHVANITLAKVDPTGAIIGSTSSYLNDPSVKISDVLNFDIQRRILENSSISNTSGSPTVDDYLTLEDADGLTLVHIDQHIIVTSDAVGGGGGGGASSISALWTVEGSNPNAFLATSGIQYTPVGKTDTLRFTFIATTAGTYTVNMNYMMSTAVAANVSFTRTHLAAGAGEDPDAALGGSTVDTFATTADTNIQQHSFDVAGIAVGDEVTILLTRAAGAPDTHGGEFRYFDGYYSVA